MATIACTRDANLRDIILALPTATDHWLADGQLHVIGVTQEELEAAATPERLDPPPVDQATAVPESVAAWAAKAVLENFGMLAGAQAAAAAAGTAWKWRFLEATRWEYAKILQLRYALNMTVEQVDNLMRLAALLEKDG